MTNTFWKLNTCFFVFFGGLINDVNTGTLPWIALPWVESAELWTFNHKCQREFSANAYQKCTTFTHITHTYKTAYTWSKYADLQTWLIYFLFVYMSWHELYILYLRPDIFQTDCENKENVMLLFTMYKRSHETPVMVNLRMVKFHCGLLGNSRVLLPSLFFFMAITRKILCEVVIKLSVGAIFSTQPDDK